MPPARRAAGTQWPKIAGHAAGTGGPQPLCLGPCQGGRAGGSCAPGGTVCGCAPPEPADPARRWSWYGCDGWARRCSRTGRCRWCWVGAAGCERLCTCQPGPAAPACPSPGRPALSLPLCPQSAPCSASGSSSPRWAKTGSSSSSWGWSWRWSAGPWTSPSPPASKVSGHWWVPGGTGGPCRRAVPCPLPPVTRLAGCAHSPEVDVRGPGHQRAAAVPGLGHLPHRAHHLLGRLHPDPCPPGRG